MQCPNCKIPLMMTERKGIEIDFCTQCRGIWLDRGELDKIIDISTQEIEAAAPEAISLKSEFKPAKSDKNRQYHSDYKRKNSREHSREHSRHWDDQDKDRDHQRDKGRDRDRDDDYYRDGGHDRDRARDRDRGRERDRDRRYDSKRYYKKKKTLLHALFDIID